MSSIFLRLIYSRRKQQKYFALLLLGIIAVCICLEVYFPYYWKFDHSYLLSSSKRFLQPAYAPNQRYVTLSYQFLDGRRWGNLLFGYASLLGIAKVNNMTALLPTRFPLKQYFTIDTVQRDSLSIHIKYEEYGRRACAYDHRTKKLKGPHDYIIEGYYQSWKYFSTATQEVRQNLRFRSNYLIPALQFHDDVLHAHTNAVRIGVHVRRTDVLDAHRLGYGYVAAPKDYFDRAMQYFRDKHKHVVFIVCSDDLVWSEEYLSADDVVFSHNTDSMIDLAILSQCEHMIMSVGSFSWWAAWFVNGTTIYYNGWPKPHSRLDYMVEKKQYFLSEWIAMD